MSYTQQVLVPQKFQKMRKKWSDRRWMGRVVFLRLLLSFLKTSHQYFSVQKLLLPVTKYMHVRRSFVFRQMCISITNFNRIICFTNCTCLAQLIATPKLSMDLVCNFPLQLIPLGIKNPQHPI